MERKTIRYDGEAVDGSERTGWVCRGCGSVNERTTHENACHRCGGDRVRFIWYWVQGVLPGRNAFEYLLNDYAASVHAMAHGHGFYGTNDRECPNDGVCVHVSGNDIAMGGLFASEVGEFVEAARYDRVVEKNNQVEEAADIIIRVLDWAAARNVDITSALSSKLQEDTQRPHLWKDA